VVHVAMEKRKTRLMKNNSGASLIGPCCAGPISGAKSGYFRRSRPIASSNSTDDFEILTRPFTKLLQFTFSRDREALVIRSTTTRPQL
jgi:hypothetical protein